MKKNRRIFAYLLDMGIITFFMSILPFLQKEKNIPLKNDFDFINELFTNKVITQIEYFDNVKEIMYQYTRQNIYTIFLGIFTILFFIILIPSMNKGKTIGKQLFGIQIQKNDQKSPFLSYIARAIINFGFLFLLVNGVSVWILKSKEYTFLLLITLFLQILLVMINGFMVLYSKSKKGLYDRIYHTTVEKIRGEL